MKNIAFASDLDRTLIYSHRMMEQYAYKGAYELIEVLDDRPLSYMSIETKASLKAIHQARLVYPSDDKNDSTI
nr:hypothetical protein [Bacillus altitudinis]